ncbi:MAG: NAD(+)/NADH kinase, partial [Prosthecobacter sp.]
GARGESAIQQTWAKGPELWETANFAVLRRPGYESTAAPNAFVADLPPNARIVDLVVEGASTTIRERLSKGQDVRGLLHPRALAYIERYGLYRAPIPGNWARGTLEDTPYFLCADTRIPKVQAVSATLDARRVGKTHAGFITVVGGDGAMLRSIREHWQARLPFFGINAGHIGFLMNAAEQVQAAAFPPGDVIFRQLPMLFLEFEDAEGRKTTAYGFNDAWLERATSQSAWLEIKVNGVPRIPKLVSDGALVATAAGSTAYARSMGASPLLADTPAWLLVGSNVLEPAHWRSALLSPDTTVEIRCLDPQMRPVQAYVDGQSMGHVVVMRARLSRAAAAELVFCASHDMAEKIAAIQFGA